MAKTEIRLFVGNIPSNISEDELKTEFLAYGNVINVEIKNKKLPNSVQNSTFAFIKIYLDDISLQNCLKEFREYQFHGQFLNVSVAREHFLEQLKREREQNANFTCNKIKTESNFTNIPKIENERSILPKIRENDTKSSGSESSEESDSSDNKMLQPTNIVEVKKLENENLTEISGKQKLKNNSIEADKKRKDSLKKMKSVYNNQKFVIKQALASIDNYGNSNKKIKFDYDDNKINNIYNKTKLFDDEDNNNDNNIDIYKNDFIIKEQFQGKQGQKLLKLQSRFNNDKRFEMNEAFLDDQYYNDEKIFNNDNSMQIDKNDERTWQYDIIEKVTGKQLQADKLKDKNRIHPMLRYDPTKEDHIKYINNLKQKCDDHDSVTSVTDATKKLKFDTKQPNNVENIVSKATFYKLSDNLSSSLKNPSKGFSLLSMFDCENEQANDNTDKYKPDFNIMDKNYSKIDLNPFLYNDNTNYNNKNNNEILIGANTFGNKDEKFQHEMKKNHSKSLVITNQKIQHERFFICDNDERLQEGELFFMGAPSDTQNGINNVEKIDDERDIQLKKQELRDIIKTKIKRTVRNKFSNGMKLNKFRKNKLKR